MADNPVTREEKYLAYLTGDYTKEIPKPITRKEKYLYELQSAEAYVNSEYAVVLTELEV